MQGCDYSPPAHAATNASSAAAGSPSMLNCNGNQEAKHASSATLHQARHPRDTLYKHKPKPDKLVHTIRKPHKARKANSSAQKSIDSRQKGSDPLHYASLNHAVPLREVRSNLSTVAHVFAGSTLRSFLPRHNQRCKSLGHRHSSLQHLA